MPCFVAFLKGINVGGHVVVKEKLQEVFDSLGFQNVVRIYPGIDLGLYRNKGKNPDYLKPN